MAATFFLANDVAMQIEDPNTPGTWLTIVCETALSADITTPVNTTSTKCGIVKAVGELGATISGSAVANVTPEADEVSLKQLLDWANTQQALVGRMINIEVGATAIGEAVLVKGSGYFTNVSPNADADQNLTFDWTFEITGSIDTTEGDESV